MKSYRIESRASQVSAAENIQSLAGRPKRGAMSDSGSRGFALCARIGVAMLYIACAIAAVAQSPEKPRVNVPGISDAGSSVGLSTGSGD